MPRFSQSSTQTLLRAAAAGDLVAREVLYARLIGPLTIWARGRLPPHARESLDTEDLVQGALVKSLEFEGEFEQRESHGFLRYLRTCIANRVCDEVRSMRRRPQRTELPDEVEDPQQSPIDRLLSQEEQALYTAALDALSPADQDLVIARVELHMGFRDIALHTGKPSPAAARVAFNRAVERLAAQIARLERDGRP